MPMAPTPIVISRRTRNILIAVVLIAFFALCWFAPAAVQMVITGIALSIVLSFPVRLLSRYVPRGAAIAIVILVLAVAGLLALVFLIPIIVNQLTALIDNAPQIVSAVYERVEKLLGELNKLGWLNSSPEQTLQSLEHDVSTRAQGMAQQGLGIVLDTATSLFGVMLTAVGVTFVTVYLLADTDRFKVAMLKMFPLVYQDDIAELWHNAGHSLSRYLSGILVSCAFQGVTSTIILFVLGVPYSLLLGIWTALACIVPYVGSYIGGVPAVLAALFVSPLAAIITAAGYFLINQIDGNLIAPRIQGQAIRVHPLLVFLAVIAGGQIGGLWGALLAVPILAILRTVYDFLQLRLVVETPAPPAPMIPISNPPVTPPPAPVLPNTLTRD